MNHIENSFVDKNRPVQTKYYDLLDSPEIKTNPKMERAMKKLIKQGPDFLDTDLILNEIYQAKVNPKKPKKFSTRHTKGRSTCHS